MLKYRFYKTLRFFHLISKKKFKKRTEKYTTEYKSIALSGFFDKKWYLKQNPDVSKNDPILHYLQKGWKENRNPSQKFDGNEYLKQYPDVKAANICPLIHYIVRGKHEKRSVFPVGTNVKDIFYKVQGYIEWLNKNNRKYEFVKITDSKCIPATDVKTIAFYLPQYHANDINNENFGQGFTEWTNVSQAIPYFTGHFQPHVPYDVGFYDLTTPNVMYRQVELAKLYGIYGFCFHYYWFSGKKALERPIQNWLNNKDLDLPFCLCWANENWSKLWDGGNKEVFIEQNHSEEDDEKFFIDILPYFTDERYIKIQNKPLFILYNALLFECDELVRFKNKLNELAQKHGFDGVYFSIVIRNSDVIDTYGDIADSLIEFPPHNMKCCSAVNYDNIYVHPNFTSTIYDIKKYVKEKNFLYDTKYKTFKGCFPSWDNSARKAFSNGYVFHNATPDVYKKWLSGCINFEENNNSQDERFVFINAWNEWGEGAHLEPDISRGYAYLQATKDALEKK